MEYTTEQKLDILAQYEAKRDGLTFEKIALLEEIKIPADVEAVVKDGMKRMAEVGEKFRPAAQSYGEQMKARLDAIIVPEEIRAALQEIDRQRDEISAEWARHEAEITAQVNAEKAKIQAETEAQTRAVYDLVAQKKADISAEYAGKEAIADRNIAALKKEIMDDVLRAGATIRGTVKLANGKVKSAVWNKGRRGTWISDKLDELEKTVPEIRTCRNPDGEPTVVFKDL